MRLYFLQRIPESALCVIVRSPKAHLDELEALALSHESPPTILCLTEIWLSIHDDFNFIY